MSDRVLMTAMICGASVVASIVISLVVLVGIRDGTDESTVITALLGVLSVIIASVGPIVTQHLTINRLTSGSQSVVDNPSQQTTP